jgi:hypothetical protein
MSNSQSELRIATTLTPEEDARWVELFTGKVETGRADDVAGRRDMGDVAG